MPYGCHIGTRELPPFQTVVLARRYLLGACDQTPIAFHPRLRPRVGLSQLNNNRTHHRPSAATLCIAWQLLWAEHVRVSGVL